MSDTIFEEGKSEEFSRDSDYYNESIGIAPDS